MSDDPAEQAARAELDKVRADPRWRGRNIEHMYSAALPKMVAAAVRAGDHQRAAAPGGRVVTEDPRIAQFERERADAVELAHRAMLTSYIGKPPPIMRGDADRMVAALLKAGWTPPGGTVVEHAVRHSGGDMQVRNPHPEVERIYPLTEWIKAMHVVHQTRVFKRRVIVVEDWTEVAPCNS